MEMATGNCLDYIQIPITKNEEKMKFIPVINKMLIGSAIVFGFSNCSKPIEEKMDEAEIKVQEERSDVIEARQNLHEVASDSVQQVEEYLIVTKERLGENTKNLKEIKNEVKSSRAISLPNFEENLSILVKRNQDLIAIANDTTAIRSDTWVNVRKELNEEMDALEKAIADLQEKSKKKL